MSTRSPTGCPRGRGKQGVTLIPGRLIGGLTEAAMETALDVEMTEYLGYESTRSPATVPATGPAPRPCRPRSARWRSRFPGTGTGRPD